MKVPLAWMPVARPVMAHDGRRVGARAQDDDVLAGGVDAAGRLAERRGRIGDRRSGRRWRSARATAMASAVGDGSAAARAVGRGLARSARGVGSVGRRRLGAGLGRRRHRRLGRGRGDRGDEHEGGEQEAGDPTAHEHSGSGLGHGARIDAIDRPRSLLVSPGWQPRANPTLVRVTRRRPSRTPPDPIGRWSARPPGVPTRISDSASATLARIAERIESSPVQTALVAFEIDVSCDFSVRTSSSCSRIAVSAEATAAASTSTSCSVERGQGEQAGQPHGRLERRRAPAPRGR